MLITISRTWLLGGWFAAVTVVVAWSAAEGAKVIHERAAARDLRLPVVVMVLLGNAGSPPTVAEILHSVNAKDGRGSL